MSFRIGAAEEEPAVRLQRSNALQAAGCPR